MKKYIFPSLFLFCAFSSFVYAYIAPPVAACKLVKIASGIRGSETIGIVRFGISTECKSIIRGVDCSGVWYVQIKDKSNKIVYSNSLPLDYDCGTKNPEYLDVPAPNSWFNNGYKANQIVGDLNTFITVIDDEINL